MPSKKQDVVVNHRNSKNGQFVTEQYVKTHPATTETERNARRNSSPSPAKKK